MIGRRRYIHAASKSLARSACVIALVTGAIFSCAAEASVGPLIEKFPIYICQWQMEKPITIFGFDKFGVRQGHFLLKTTHDGEPVAIYLSPQLLARRGFYSNAFAACLEENKLVEIAKLAGAKPLRLLVNSIGQVEEIKVIESPEELPILSDTAQDFASYALSLDDPDSWKWANNPQTWKWADGTNQTSGNDIKVDNGFAQRRLKKMTDYWLARGWQYAIQPRVLAPSQTDWYIDPETPLALFIWFLTLCPVVLICWVQKRALKC